MPTQELIFDILGSVKISPEYKPLQSLSAEGDCRPQILSKFHKSKILIAADKKRLKNSKGYVQTLRPQI